MLRTRKLEWVLSGNWQTETFLGIWTVCPLFLCLVKCDKVKVIERNLALRNDETILAKIESVRRETLFVGGTAWMLSQPT